jgi:hypothetical protein
MRPKGKLLALVVMFAAVGLITATGAFTTVEAERTATVDVAGDSNALLELEEGPQAPSGVVADGQELSIDLTSGNLGASGLNQNANTTFDGLINVTNQGTNNNTELSYTTDVSVTSGSGSSSDVEVILYDSSGSEIDNTALTTGNTVYVGFKLVLSGGLDSTSNFNVDITFSAEDPNADNP